ncbi:translocation/assembly module TamB domain-containing protein [Schlegelella sp. S2-27]|uniref:Translocation/assembly module TamB domain-containing protein n=1 Tax=Caldimonas mangrovi TaxID=2944811 RepID=A0ABT0YWI9_9BURK|nr:translocation/assembly module TamB domain-containing protein [Caldimonas mangrovi]MCM5682531.1 translocation/assembly module TamB domain-containing protein [Caldimonas mangrovi]
MADAPVPPAVRPRGTRRWWPWALAVVALLAAAAAAGLYAGLRWVLYSEAGTRWALEQAAARLPGFTVREPLGTLAGDFQAAQLTVPAGTGRIEISRLRWTGLRPHGWQWTAPYLQLSIAELTIGRLSVQPGPPSGEQQPAGAPASLRLPLGVQIGALRVDELLLPGQAVPVTGLRARVTLGDAHRVEAFSAAWNGLRAEGQARIGADAPMSVDAGVRVRSDPAAAAASQRLVPEWAESVQAELKAAGPLAQLAAELSLRMQDQTLQAGAVVTPFEPLPLSRLDARFAQLDLARLLAPFIARAPTTSLSGSAVLTLRDTGQPLGVDVDVTNADPGAWNALRLPLSRAVVRASGEGQRWTVQRAELQAAGGAGSPAGRVTAEGSWNAGELTLKAALDTLVLEALDQRLPPMRLSGPVEFDMKPATASEAAFGELRVSTKLQGGLTQRGRAGAPAALQNQPVQLSLEATATPTRYRIASLDARAGDARLAAKGRAERSSSGERWAVQAGLQLQAFNPALWLPGTTDSAWRRQRHALNGTVDLEAQVPAAAPHAAEMLRQLRGKLDARFDGSVLAGQPANLSLTLSADGAGRLESRGQLQAAGNSAALEALVRVPADARAASDDDNLHLTLDAPSLQRLAGLVEGLGLERLQGSAQLDASAQGPLGGWIAQAATPPAGPPAGSTAVRPALPAFRTQGSADVRDLRFNDMGLDRLLGHWDASTEGDARIAADVKAEQLRLPGLHLPSAAVLADGNTTAHRVQLDAELRPAMQQQAIAQANAQPAPAPLTLRARLQGGFEQRGGAAPSGWRGVIEELALRPTDAAPAALRGRDPLPLLVAENLRLAWTHEPGVQSLQVEPGQLRLLGEVLRWSEARWRSTQGEQQLALEAEVEPVAVTPLLRRVQPGFGWEGDLRIGARISMHSEPTVTARVEIARAGGDLRINEFGVVQSLGLSELLLRFDAAGGVWNFTQRIAGSNLGRIAGQQTVRTSPTALWPEPQAPVDGQLEVRVENLAGWGVWVPAGWRLGGQLTAQLGISGNFGSPDLVGRLEGRQLTARNAIEGVNLRDGTVRLSFEGETARIETFRFSGGEGTAGLQGTAQLGENPRAELQLQAQRFALLSRVDRRVVVSGEASVQLGRERIAVNGRFRADEGLVDISRADAPSLSDDVVVRRAGDAPLTNEMQPAAPAADTSRALELNLLVDLGERFRLRGRGIDTRLEGQLRLASPRNRLAVQGEIRTEGGKYEAYGQELEIERGVLTFVGEVSNPRLDIVAIRPNMDVRVGVTVSGSALSPRVTLFSEPPLPDTETLALLITGRSYDTLAGNQTLLLQRAALALLAGDGSGEGGGNIMEMLPLDELSVRQTEGAVPDTVVTIGKQISDRIYVGYERGLSAAAGSWQVIYRIAQRFTLRAQAGQDSALDLVWMFRWN